MAIKDEEVKEQINNEPNYPIIKERRKMITYLIIARIKDSEENPWIEFETDNKEVAQKKCNDLSVSKKNIAFKIETRTLYNEQIEEFKKIKKNSEWIDKMNDHANTGDKA